MILSSNIPTIVFPTRRTMPFSPWKDFHWFEKFYEVVICLLIFWGLNEALDCQTLCCCSVPHFRPPLCDPTDCSMPGFPVLHYLPEFAQTHVIESVRPSNHLIFCCPLLLLPSIFPSIMVFSSEMALHIRWAKYWSFSLSTNPSNEYAGLQSTYLTVFVQTQLEAKFEREKWI